ncbi:hypothetical protein LTR95_009933 [Oleoguttula sp. CCFEE 5521]
MRNAAPADGGHFLSLRIKYGRWKYGFFGAGNTRAGFRVSETRFIKWPCKQPELEGHLYVLQHTDLPVPQIHATYIWRGHLAIEMEYLPDCVSLAAVWYELTKVQKDQVVEQIAGYINTLRALKPPSTQGNRVSATNGGPCRDVRVSTMNLSGPFDDVHAFHRCLSGNTTNLDAVTETYGDAVFNVHSRSYEIYFTHGDLGVQNILIRDGKVAAIIDWECSGWWPEYWEYTKVHYNEWRCPDFYEMLRERVPRYDVELAAERELWEAFNRPLDQKEWKAT